MGEFAVWPRNIGEFLIRQMSFPEANLAFAFAIMATRKATDQAIMKLTLGHRNDIVLRMVDCWIVVAFLVNKHCSKFDNSSEPIKHVLEILLRYKSIAFLNESSYRLRSF